MVEGVWELKEIFYKHINEFKINIISPYGDGHTSKKICDILEN